MIKVTHYLCLITFGFFTVAHADDFDTSQIFELNTTKSLSTLDASKELKWEIGAITWRCYIPWLSKLELGK